ncbi:MAG: hypothetical protein Q8R79_01090, partial [Legionellaceae bacterium]|nr:hypothetical protein [Legionellaceae bacterium]
TLDQAKHVKTSQTDNLFLSSKSRKDTEIAEKLLVFKWALFKNQGTPNNPEIIEEVRASFKALCYTVSQRRNKISKRFFKHDAFSTPDSAKGLTKYLSQPEQENLRTLLELPKETNALAQAIADYACESENNPPSVSP